MNRTRDQRLPAAESDPVLNQLCDEIIERLQAGDQVDMASLAFEHPEHADQLRRLLPALEALVDLGASAAQNPSRVVSKPDTSDLAPKVLGDYRILREIGRGGMGVVYEAEQRSLNRRVALKVLPMAAALDARQFERFQLEAQAAACLHHNNIVPVFAVGTEGGVPFYAMQFIEGRSLAQVIAELRRAEGLDPAAPEPHANQLHDLTTTALARSLIAGETTQVRATGPGAVAETDAQPPQPAPNGKPASAWTPASSPRAGPGSSTHTRAYARTVAGLGLQAAEALDHAHARGILHRDIKPGNLLLDAEGRLWVADFGLAQIQGSPSMTLSGDVLGTLRYMSPEQALGKRVVIDGRTDVYSLGVTLYELLTLRPALDGKDRAEILRKITSDDPDPLRRHNPSVPTDLETIIHKALAKEPAERYATAKDLADDLRYYLDDRPIRARQPGLLDRAAKWARRHTAIVTAASVILVLATIGLATSMILITREQRRTLTALEQADTRLHLARKAVDEMYTQVAQKWLSREGALTPLQREFLEKALAFYEAFARERADDPKARAEAGQAAARVGEIRSHLGLSAGAMESHRRALDAFRLLAAEFPGEPEYRRGVAESLSSIGRLHETLGQSRDVEQAYREALALREQLARAPGRPDDRADLAGALLDLDALLDATGQAGDGELIGVRAAQLLSRLVAEFPREDRYKGLLAGAEMGLGDYRDAEREVGYRQSLALRLEVMRNHPDDPSYREAVVVSYQRLGHFYRHTFRYDKAAAEYRKALPLAEKLVADHPARPEFRALLAKTFLRLADQLARLAQFDEAERALRRWQEIAEQLVADFPDVPSYRDQLALGSLQRGSLHAQRGRNGEARAAFERAYEIQRTLVREHPELKGFLVNLGWICYSAAVDYATLDGREARDATRARELAREAVAIEPDAGYLKGLALAEYRAGDLDAALKAETKALEIRKGNGYHYDWLILALIHLERGDRGQARTWAERLLRGVAPSGWSGGEGEADFVRLVRESEQRLRALLPAEPDRPDGPPRLE